MCRAAMNTSIMMAHRQTGKALQAGDAFQAGNAFQASDPREFHGNSVALADSPAA
jgi:hypothetical protein